MRNGGFKSILNKSALFLFVLASGLISAGGMKVHGQEGSQLDLARVEVQETTDLTTVTGWDSGGREVGRLELLHGSFEMSGFFAADRDDPSVTGRRLTVSALGKTMHWETEGFAPTLDLPAHPPGQGALAAFLEDARVKPVLTRWGIGFTTGPQRKADAPYVCDLEGTNPRDCSGEATCDTLLVRMNPLLEIPPPGTCARSVPAPAAWTVYQRANAGYHLDHLLTPEVAFTQSVVAQCCPEIKTETSTNPAAYQKKTCPESLTCTAASPCKTSCGPVIRPGACVGCPAYHDLTKGKCAMRVQHAGWRDLGSPKSKEVYEVCARFDWTCNDGFCDADEDCENCAADCACHGDNLCVPAASPDGGARCCEFGQCDDD